MKNLICAVLASVAMSSAAQACPYAGNTFRATLGPDISAVLTVNAECSSVRIRETEQNTDTTGDLVATGKGWASQGAFPMQVELDANGKRARFQKGGLSRTVTLKKIK